MYLDAPITAENPDNFVEHLFAWLEREGQTKYDSSVTQLEHALQTANLAVIENAHEFEVVAALLHDVGHLLMNENSAESDFLASDLMHESVGAEWLQKFFPDQLVTAVRYHVPAKRYLCAIDETYYKGLSAASTASLRVQGGPMTEEECSIFENLKGWQSAVALRKRDDRAKMSGKDVPSINAYRDLVIKYLK